MQCNLSNLFASTDTNRWQYCGIPYKKLWWKFVFFHFRRNKTNKQTKQYKLIQSSLFIFPRHYYLFKVSFGLTLVDFYIWQLGFMKTLLCKIGSFGPSEPHALIQFDSVKEESKRVQKKSTRELGKKGKNWHSIKFLSLSTRARFS